MTDSEGGPAWEWERGELRAEEDDACVEDIKGFPISWVAMVHASARTGAERRRMDPAVAAGTAPLFPSAKLWTASKAGVLIPAEPNVVMVQPLLLLSPLARHQLFSLVLVVGLGNRGVTMPVVLPPPRRIPR